MNNFGRIQEVLLARREELTTRLEQITSDVRHEEEPLSADFAEQATERENDEVMDALGAQARHELSMISDALRRIEADEFGECLECGELINEQRLEALPFARTCINCAEVAEKTLDNSIPRKAAPPH
ncbi:MAG: TraR/DksA C4-type zinc finger protein [Gammaproteobacteria bacterium]|nr:TraR/DksA C4-type zinc finger protein [Gammaproteobacteria bacterium]